MQLTNLHINNIQNIKTDIMTQEMKIKAVLKYYN